MVVAGYYALCDLANEVDGLEWRTLIDGNREAPVLTSVAGDTVIDPMKLVWSKVKVGEPCNLAEVYRNLLHDKPFPDSYCRLHGNFSI